MIIQSFKCCKLCYLWRMNPLRIRNNYFDGTRYNRAWVLGDIFFSAGCFFSQEFISMHFSSRNQRAGHFFLKSPITPSKVKWSALKIYQKFGQLTDSDLSIISKDFWNNRRQNSQGERGGIRFYLPLPGKSVRSYLRTDVRWRHNQIFSNG